MRLIISSSLFLIILLCNSCATVQTKVDEKTKEEQDRLSVYIGKNIEETFIDFGQPFSDGLDEKGFRKVTFKNSKLGVKCIRTFTVDNSNTVTGFESSGCF
mgnify:FL=1|tara:strand:+ start:190 stop:492 length:303 start_codon:yes stop_codon:yes gene_type:complete